MFQARFLNENDPILYGTGFASQTRNEMLLSELNERTVVHQLIFRALGAGWLMRISCFFRLGNPETVAF